MDESRRLDLADRTPFEVLDGMLLAHTPYI
jgi:hypothetical protein